MGGYNVVNYIIHGASIGMCICYSGCETVIKLDKMVSYSMLCNFFHILRMCVVRRYSIFRSQESSNIIVYIILHVS